MSFPIVLSIFAIEAFNLVLLWTALRVRLPRVARPLVASVGLSGAWGAWVLVIVVHGPGWMMALTGLVFALSAVAMGVAIHLATYEQEDGSDGGAGGGPSVAPDAPGGGGDDEPLWWPDFERQMAAYAARREREPEREREPVDC